MPAPTPDPSQVMQAIDIYLRNAYGDEPPVTVRSQLAVLKGWGGPFFRAPVFVADTQGPNGTTRYSMRLGNRHYPHMKLVIDRAPDGRSYLLRADTHDAHCQPRPGSRESASFADLARQNRAVAEAIEARWEAVGLPTFKKFLRDDLERRKAAGPEHPEPPRQAAPRSEPNKPRA